MRRSLFISTLVVFSLSFAACQRTVEPTPEATDAPAPSADAGSDVAVDGAAMQESSVSFVGGSSIVDHPGVFERFSVKFEKGATDVFADGTLRASIDLTSVKTDAAGLDGHLQKADFFDTAVYPEATFVSTAIVPRGENQFTITGDLNLKGMTKSVVIEAVVADGWIMFTYDLPRREFSIGNDSYGDKLLDETVPVTVKAKL